MPTSRRPLALIVVLLLVFLWSRAHEILLLPLFLDESSHLTRAQWVWEGKPFFLLQTGKALAPYIASLMNPYSVAPYIGRIVVALLGMIGIVAAYAIGRDLHSRQAGLLVMGLWIVCPQLFFFERMALVDTTMSAMALLALWLAIRMLRGSSVVLPILCGVALVLTVTAKFTGIVYLPIPIAVAFLVGKLSWKLRLRQIVICYLIAGALLAPMAAYLTAEDIDPTGQSTGLTSTDTNTLPARLERNLTNSLNAEVTYFGAPFLSLAAAAVLIALLSMPLRTLLILAWIAIPFAAIVATAQSLWLRYLSPLAPFILIIIAFGVFQLGKGVDRLLRRSAAPNFTTAQSLSGSILAAVLVVLWSLGIGVPFIVTAYRAPDQLPLPAGDRREYIEWIPSGYGIRDAADYINEHLDQPVTLIGTAVNCNAARLYLKFETPVTMLCPGMDWSGRNPELVADIKDRIQQEGEIYILTEDKQPPTVDIRNFDGRQEIASFSRPSDRYTVRLFIVRAGGLPPQEENE
ncbi:MAG: glycosyltransferase family 39 protein [Anaerolineae bacterium]